MFRKKKGEKKGGGPLGLLEGHKAIQCRNTAALTRTQHVHGGQEPPEEDANGRFYNIF